MTDIKTKLPDDDRLIAMADDRRAALADFKRMIKWIAVAGVLMVVAALAYLHLFISFTPAIVIATTLGVFLSVLLGCGLFAAAFFSEKSGFDQQVADATLSQRNRAQPRTFNASKRS